MSQLQELSRPGRLWTHYLPGILLLIQAVLLFASAYQNAVTIDEVCHLPAGISYWQQGEFWCYHHNPPLIRLLYALPSVILDTPMDYSHYQYEPGSRMPDCLLGRDFMLLNRNHYMEIYSLARVVVVLLTLWGSWSIYRFSRTLFGAQGACVSLAIWCLDPNVLAHGGLVTTDVGSTVIGFVATIAFWHYLRSPSNSNALKSGVWLGLTIASKFSFVILPGIWGGLACLHYIKTPDRLPGREYFRHGVIVAIVSLLVLNSIYLFEGTGKRLGDFEFKSRGLTHASDTPEAKRVNRFRETLLSRIPVPLPEHFVQGFDSQLYDVDSGSYTKYLRGELRDGPGWWYYYLYCVAVKTPTGILGVCLISVLLWVWSRRSRRDVISEATLIIPVVVYTWALSANTGLNSHLRYMLPAYPWVAVFAGRVGPWLEGMTANCRRGWSVTFAGCLLSAAWGVLGITPHFLTFFNAPAGGPNQGIQHLADSNIDWGQGLLAVRDWLKTHPQKQPLSLAYFGTMYPEVLGIDYHLPPLGPQQVPFETGVEFVEDLSEIEEAPVGPVPGIHLVSANYLLGIAFPAPNGQGSQSGIPKDGFAYFRRFPPKEILANSIYVFELHPTEVATVRREMNLPPLKSDRSVAFRATFE